MFKNLSFLIILFITAQTFTLLARPNYPGYVPYGDKFSCNMCHISGSSLRNEFGITVEENMTKGSPDWSKIFDIDSDGDDVTNGAELQDPNGDWEYGDKDPGNEDLVSKPWDINSTPPPNSVEFINEVNSLNIRFSDTGKLTVNFDSKFSSNAVLKVFDLSGNILSKSSRFINEGENKFDLNLSDKKLSIGVYFLIIESDKYYLREKFIYTE